MKLPPGTITFLLTDIEGSTRLWEEHPGEMRSALARHDALAGEIIERHSGNLIRSKGEGDSVFAVFPVPADAVAAACALQQALASEPWPHATPLRVRMAVHTGEADLRDGDYYGASVNRCARLRAIGHGGQALISQAVQTLTGLSLPPQVSLRDMGSHRLKDLSQPERVFQLCIPGLPQDFPALCSLSATATNLPIQTTSFIGRERELAEVKALLGRARLLTLTGSGGTGKTRLSQQAAADVADAYRDGVWLVELAPLSDAVLLHQTVVSVLGVKEEGGKPLLQSLVETLRAKQLLLLLDNCEHVLDSAAGLADALLKHCPEVRVLASSREALGVTGEQTFRVPSLGIPPSPGRARTMRTTELLGYDSVRLFTERAVLVKSDFAVSSVTAPALARLCHRLDGIPLAIELAAARVRAMPVEQIESRLHDRFRLLTGGSRTALPRQRTLQALIDWSYDLLGETERQLFCRLSVFAGGWTLESAEKVCIGGAVGDWGVLDLLTALVDKSLVVYDEEAGEGRYRLLETVHQYAREKLNSVDETRAYRRQHRDYYVSIAEEAREKIHGPDQATWLNRLESEHDNFRAALEFCEADSGSGEVGLRLVRGLLQFWLTRGYFSEGWERTEAMLAHAGAQEMTAARSRVLNGGGLLAFYQGRYAQARSLHEAALVIDRRLDYREGIAIDLNNLANVVCAAEGDYATGRTLYEEALSINRELGNRRNEAASLSNLGIIAQRQGQYEQSQARYEQALAIRRKIGDKTGVTMDLATLASLASRQGNSAAAHTHLVESLLLCQEIGEQRVGADVLDGFAPIASGAGQHRRAAHFLGAAQALREAIGCVSEPVDPEEHERCLAAIRAALGDSAFDVAHAEGHRLSWESAIAYALDEKGSLESFVSNAA